MFRSRLRHRPAPLTCTHGPGSVRVSWPVIDSPRSYGEGGAREGGGQGTTMRKPSEGVRPPSSYVSVMVTVMPPSATPSTGEDDGDALEDAYGDGYDSSDSSHGVAKYTHTSARGGALILYSENGARAWGSNPKVTPAQTKSLSRIPTPRRSAYGFTPMDSHLWTQPG